MSKPNSNVEEFLEYYCLLGPKPGYAVLVKGRWGTGKTWFVKRTLKSFEEKGCRHLYVSLYGMTSTDDIEGEFFRQLHPVLSSKSIGLAGKIAKGMLRTTINIDFDGDGSSDANISAKIPNIQLPKYLTDTEGFVIVFDDLERASIPVESLLGYINHFVEHQGHKVIIVANEEEILDHQEKADNFKSPYRRVKEKLIGKTFEITSDTEGALTDFFCEVKSNQLREFLESNIKVISELYQSSGYGNLRNLRQTLWDFERFSKLLDNDVLAKKDLLLHLLEIFLMLSFEIRSGNILPKEIARLRDEYFSRIINRDKHKEKDTTHEKIIKKYPRINFGDLLIEESIWADFFDKGTCSKERIKGSLSKSKYFESAARPDWVRLWHSLHIDDNEFSAALASVEQDFYAMKFTELGEIKHVVGILLWLSKIKLFGKTRKQILKFSCLYIDNLKENGILFEKSKDHVMLKDDVWEGLGFHERDSEEFKTFIQHIQRRCGESLTEEYPKIAMESLKLLNKDPNLFYRRMIHSSDPESTFYEIPIFSYIAPQDFVVAFLDSSPEARKFVSFVFSDRYRHRVFNDALVPELEWLKKVVGLLDQKRRLLKGTITGYQLQLHIDNHLNPAIDALEGHRLGMQK